MDLLSSGASSCGLQLKFSRSSQVVEKGFLARV